MTERRPRRAVGPPGAFVPVAEPIAELPRQDVDAAPAEEQDRADEQRLRRERPPHHDQER